MDIVEGIRSDLGSDEGRITDNECLVELWGRAVDIGTRARAAVRDSIRWAHHEDRDLGGDIAAIVEDLTAAERKFEEHGSADARRGWREWLEGDGAQGAKRAHSYTKIPKGWVPTVATTARGVLSAAPSSTLDAMRATYAADWEADERPVAYRWSGQCDELPRLAPQQLRDASLSFARRTAVTYDGWHVRQFALVGDEGLSVLAELLAAVEAAGMWPSQTSLVTMPLREGQRWPQRHR